VFNNKLNAAYLHKIVAHIESAMEPVVNQQHVLDIVATQRRVFELTDEQLTALPSVNDVDLIPQDDSHHIESSDYGVRAAHPFKLFIGETGGEPCYVYLFKNKRGMKMEISGVDDDGGGYFPPFDAQYFASVQDLAYPFNEFLGAGRFIATVKFYFYLGHQIGLFSENPGFEVTKSWRKDLQGACDDLIVANARIAMIEKQAKERALAHKHQAPTVATVLPPQNARPRDHEPQMSTMARGDRDDKSDWGQPPPRPPQPNPNPYDQPSRQFYPYPVLPQPSYYPPPTGFLSPPAHYFPPPPSGPGYPPPPQISYPSPAYPSPRARDSSMWAAHGQSQKPVRRPSSVSLDHGDAQVRRHVDEKGCQIEARKSSTKS
jgi:hypothetical protein